MVDIIYTIVHSRGEGVKTGDNLVHVVLNQPKTKSNCMVFLENLNFTEGLQTKQAYDFT